MDANRSYWRAREEAQRLLDMRSDAAREREYSTLYKRAFDDIQKEIDAFYSRYADAEGISIAEAHKRVSRLDIEAYARKAKAYVAEKNFTKQANEEMRLYNLTMKVNRLEMLKAKIALELAAKGSAEERHLKATLDEATRQELERQSGILGDTVKHDANPKQIQRIVEGDFHNATFSQRIWNNNKLLQMAIEKELQTVLIQGKRPDYKKLAQMFDASENAAKRLLHTETKRVRTEAAKERYLENGIDDFEYMALGPNPCPICSDLNGKHFPVKKMMSGENAPPMHPNCRCSTAPWVDEVAYNAWLDAKASGEFEGGFDEWKLKAKSVELPRELLEAKNVPEDIKDMITSTVDKIIEEYGDIGIDNMEFAPYYPKPKAPFSFIPAYTSSGLFKPKLNINTLFDWNDSLEEFDKRVYNRSYLKGVLASQKAEDLIYHEAAHFITFKNCQTESDYMFEEMLVRQRYIYGVSGYSNTCEDGAETIAEGLVKYRNGDPLDERVLDLLKEYIFGR